MNKNLSILITNDDGINANGLKALIEVAKEFGTLTIVAPHKSRSGMSKAITVETPLRLKKVQKNENAVYYSCTGTPVDCVKIAFDKVLERTPDLILSGVNHGTNSSVSVHYSGTVGAVIEGCIHDVPSIGFSLLDFRSDANFEIAKKHMKSIIRNVLEEGLSTGVCLNVNFPKDHIEGIKVCRMGKGRWVEEFQKRTDPHHRDYYWITGYFKCLENGSNDSDTYYLEQNYATIVPIKIDLTDQEAIESISKWNLE